MSPYTRGALFVIRLVAFGLIILGVTLTGSYFFYVVAGEQAQGGLLPIVFKSLFWVAGIVLWIKSGSIARKLTQDLDD